MNFEKIVAKAYGNILIDSLDEFVESSFKAKEEDNGEIESLVRTYKGLIKMQQELTAESLRIYHEKLANELKKQGVNL